MRQIGTQIKNYIIVFKDKERKSEFITEQKADAIAKALQDQKVTYIEMADQYGNFSELLEKREIKSIKRVDDNENEGKNAWVCDHNKPQSMSQGCYTDSNTGKREWKADCAC